MINKNDGKARKNNNSIAKPAKKLRHTLLAVAIAQAVIVPSVQAAALIFVNNEGDSNVGCTLREAVQTINDRSVGSTDCVNSGGPFLTQAIDGIGFSPGVNTITLSNSALDINHNMQISGSGVTIQKLAELNDRIMIIDGAFNVELIGLTLRGGLVTGLSDGAVIKVKTAIFSMRDGVIENGTGGGGGGLSLDGAVGSLINSTVTGNSATLNGGGIEIVNSSTLTLFNSTISNNSAGNVGGGISVDFTSTTTINTSTISSNTAKTGGGIHLQRTSNLTLNQSLIVQNSAEYGGGGLRANLNSNTVIANSTISGNNAGKWGGGVYSRNSPISIINSTVTNNTASLKGAGLYAFGKPSDGSPNFSLLNSIIANSSGSADCSVSTSSFSASPQNIIADGSCGTATITANPRLAPLADNGGPTLSHALLINSPAISAGSNVVCTASPINGIDQRGKPRANPANATCDLGAVELPDDLLFRDGFE